MEKKPESIFINRELSWLDFDSRVLALAKEKTVPLGERIKFAAITPRVAELQAKCDKYFQHLVTALAAEGYRKVDFAKLSKPQEHFWKT